MYYIATTKDLLFAKARKIFQNRVIIWPIILFGIILRIHQYIFNRSFWYDEASIAINIIDRSLVELLKPLEYNQGAPLGFLFIEKLTTLAMGDTEYVFRLFPFLCGIIGILIFYRLAKTTNSEKGVIIAVALYAVSSPLIYYSSELKQYSSDVTIALFLYLIAVNLMPEKLSIGKIIYSSVIGAVAIWLSHPAVFVLSGIGFNLFMFSLIKKDWSKTRKLSVIFGIWGFSFFLCYMFSLDNLIQNKFLTEYWKDYFMPFPPTSLSDFIWYPDSFFEIFSYPIGIPFKGLAASLFLIGCYSMLRKNSVLFGMLVFPLIFLAIASALHRYPMGSRLILFAVPNFIIFIAEGAEYITTNAKHKSVEVGIVILLLLFFYPFTSTLKHLHKPRTNEELRQTLEYIDKRKSENDVVFLLKRSQRAFEYYRKRLDFRGVTVIEASAWPTQFDRLKEELDNLRNFKRVWVVWTLRISGAINQDDIVYRYLDNLGNKADSFKGNERSGVYLYEFNKQ